MKITITRIFTAQDAESKEWVARDKSGRELARSADWTVAETDGRQKARQEQERENGKDGK